ncbi:MAG: OmpA family protein [Bryobacteraceae bacterium]|jgi:outer membrane protein OmpA-like peptidoglycan-associated protein
MKLTGVFLVVCGVLSAQGLQNQPIYRVTVTARTAKAISYQHRSGATKIDFRGTELLPGASGEAKVQSKQGRMQIEVEFDGLQPAIRNGAEYLTYVLWAVTPEGRTANLGEVLLNGTKSKLEVTTELQVFALVVTAEPYYAVRQPSDLIVMENVVRADTVGKIEEVDAKYELLQRGEYQRLANPLALKMDRKLPLELYEARNAVQIARAVGADRFATQTFQKAEKNLSQAEAYQARKAGEKPVAMTAREAVQMAEDSRAIAVKRQEDEALTAERQGSAEREIRAENGRAVAQSETDRVTREAEAARVKAREESERLTREKDEQTLAASSEAVRVKRDSDARLAAAAADADRQRADSDARLAAAAAGADRQRIDSDSRMAAAGTEADRLKRENDVERAASQAALDSAAKQTARLETERVELRTLLLSQFNAILQTRDTARGLIVNMSDVLFDTGKSTLRPLAREKLAKVAGIVSGHPGLRLDVEGYTDSVGGDEYNQQLSEQRGTSVRDYLMMQGMQGSSVTAKGFGKTQPVASNDTAEGRQQNRRVELVISGEVIGTEIGIPIANR